LIWVFNISSLIPFVKDFKEQITANLKQGNLPLGEWELLYSQVSRILIKVSTKDFWKELMAFHQDQELLNLLGLEAKSVIYGWASFGAALYGLDWLSRMVTEYSGFPDKVKAMAMLSIEQSSSIVISKNPSEREMVKRFLELARQQLTSH
jgi:hypothetical protein